MDYLLTCGEIKYTAYVLNRHFDAIYEMSLCKKAIHLLFALVRKQAGVNKAGKVTAYKFQDNDFRIRLPCVAANNESKAHKIMCLLTVA